MKKLFAALLALVMMLSVMSVTAFAADSYTISVPTNDSHTYAVYQIFTGDLSDGVLSNAKWGVNGTIKTGAVSKDVLTALEAVKDSTSNTAKLAVINQYVDLDSTPVATVSKTDSYSAAPGYYLIKDSGAVASDDAYTTYIVEIIEDVSISRKADVPSVDKEIMDPTETKTNEASIGDKVNYQITGTLPSNLDDYNTYYYQFNDTMSKGLTYNKDLKVSVGGVDVTKYFFVNASTYDATNGTTIKVTIADLLALSKLDGVNITKDSEIVLTYSATLNKDAVIAGEGNPNDVDLKYSNNPNDSGEPTTGDEPDEPNDEPTTTKPTGVTPKSEVKTYTTELTITKINDKDHILTGAEFELTGNGVNVMVVTKDSFVEDTNGSYWKLKDGSYTTNDPATEGMDQTKYESTTIKYAKNTTTDVLGKGQEDTNVKAFVGDDGQMTFTGLGAGTYTLTETTTPAGYNTIAPIEFTVGFQVNEDKTVTFTSTNPNVVVGATNTLATTVVNQAGATLPETGGIGTRIFYAVGGILLVGAAVMLVAKKRMDAED